ncbi:9216_t:CDS:2, partial [Acaulospora colombiana]
MLQKRKKQQTAKAHLIVTGPSDSIEKSSSEKGDAREEEITENSKSAGKKHSKKKRSKIKSSYEKDKIERKLEALVFGDGEIEELDDAKERDHEKSREGEMTEVEKDGSVGDTGETSELKKPIFVIDTSASVPTVSIDELEAKQDDKMEDLSNDDSESFEPASAWHDSDDERIFVSLKSKNMLKKLRKTEEENIIPGDQYEMRLRHQFEKIYPMPKWATKSRKRKREGSDSDHSTNEDSSDEGKSDAKHNNEEDQVSERIIEIPKIARSKLLPAGKLEVTKVKDANQQAYSQAGTIDRSSGIIGFEYKSLENFSISPCGKYICFPGSNGNLVLVNYQTKQFVATMKMNGTVNSVNWSSDGKYLFSIGKDAE